MLFGQLLAGTLDFGVIDCPVQINWDGDLIKWVANGIHNDKDV